MYASVLNTDGKQVWMASQPPSQLEQSAAAYQEPVYAACEAPSSRNRPSPSALQSLPFRTSSLATIYGSTNAAYHQTENWGSKSDGAVTPPGITVLPGTSGSIQRAPSGPAPSTPLHSSSRSSYWQRNLVFILLVALACVSMVSLYQHFALQHIAFTVSSHRAANDVQLHRLQDRNDRLSQKLEQAQGKLQDLQAELDRLRKNAKDELTNSQRETAICRQTLQKVQQQQQDAQKQQRQQKTVEQQKAQQKLKSVLDSIA